MPKLTAKFVYRPSSWLLVQLPSESDLYFNHQEDDFNIDFTFQQDKTWANQPKGDLDWIRGISTIIISITREDAVLPPPPGITALGGNDWSTQQEYFSERPPHYKEVVVRVLNRIIRYFKFTLHQPLLREVDEREQFLQNPEWVNENDEPIGKAGYRFVVKPIPGVHFWRYGANYLTTSLTDSFKKAIGSDTPSTLYEELLSDAQSAAVEGNYRRAILELAISCEVAVKQKFFASPTPAGSAFEYLEDKGRVHLSVIELIDNVANQAFGQSFRILYKNDNDNIVLLYRCRNKVAHRGVIEYKTDNGTTNHLTKETLSDWFSSVRVLFNWLQTLL